jgi:hypothetical protein
MIRVLEDLPGNVVGIEAIGRVTDDDYEKVLVPAVKAALDANEKIRFIYVLPEEFEGWTPGALWQDAKLGIKDITHWQKIAIVGDRDWLRHMVTAFGWMMPGEVRVFGLDELEAAKEWAAG